MRVAEATIFRPYETSPRLCSSVTLLIAFSRLAEKIISNYLFIHTVSARFTPRCWNMKNSHWESVTRDYAATVLMANSNSMRRSSKDEENDGINRCLVVL